MRLISVITPPRAGTSDDRSRVQSVPRPGTTMSLSFVSSGMHGLSIVSRTLHERHSPCPSSEQWPSDALIFYLLVKGANMGKYESTSRNHKYGFSVFMKSHGASREFAVFQYISGIHVLTKYLMRLHFSPLNCECSARSVGMAISSRGGPPILTTTDSRRRVRRKRVSGPREADSTKNAFPPVAGEERVRRLRTR